MRTKSKHWNWRKLAGAYWWAVAASCLAFVVSDPSIAFGQRDRGGGGGKGGGGGANVGGGGGAQVGGGAGANVRVPAVGGGAQINTPATSGGARVRTPAATGGAQVRVPEAGGGATVRSQQGQGKVGAGANIPGANAGARVNTPATTGGAQVRLPTASGQGAVGGQIAAPQVNVNPNAAATAKANAAAAARANANAAARANANAAGEARTALRPQLDNAANVGANAGANFRAKWYNAPSAGFRTTLDGAVNTRAANRASMNNWLEANPNRARYWSNWGGNVRNNFYYGGNPYFGSNFWSGRNLIGLGLAATGVGGYGGYGYGNYAIGGPGGGWWGYSPWMGNYPGNYWYGNPGWNTFAGYYGWNTPYYYDYGPNGNVVYQGNQVLVNDQPVGTAADYSQSAAELAAVTPEQMSAQHEWMPLGTFSVATSQEETNPARVAQLAYDNKQGLISGTIFNRESGNLYTVQGQVDPQTQRVAFTIGKDPNTVFETGLYNLTQQETPVLVHFGPTKTSTYLFARLPEPKESDQPATTATAPTPATQSADDILRE